MSKQEAREQLQRASAIRRGLFEHTGALSRSQEPIHGVVDKRAVKCREGRIVGLAR